MKQGNGRRACPLSSCTPLEQNVAAADVRLDERDLAALDAAFPPGAASGARYADMSAVDR